MKKLLFLSITILVAAQVMAQAPLKFNYQAVVRDISGTIIPDQQVGLRISILKGSVGGTVAYSETHTATTNAFGQVAIEIGGGSSTDDFSEIGWGEDNYFMKVEIDPSGGTAYTEMGTDQVLSVPYALVARSVDKLNKLDILGDINAPVDSSLFEVKRSDGQTVFAVYNQGVRIYVDDTGAKGPKGGFAIGGFNGAKGLTNEYLRVTPDSVRIYVDDNPAVKGPKGGFAIGSFTQGKTGESGLMHLTPENYFIGHDAGLNTLSSTTSDNGKYNSFIGYKSGTANTIGIGNIFLGYQSGTSNTEGQYNVFIGNQAGYSNIGEGSFIGDYNVFIGYASGYFNTEGQSNVFIGKQCGWRNTTGRYNTFAGQNTGIQNIDGNFNTYYGAFAGEYKTSGSNNTIIGYQAGSNNGKGSGNVFIGARAGNNEDGSNKFYLLNGSGTRPMIYGDFITAGHKVVINGDSISNLGNTNFFVSGSAGGTSTWGVTSDLRLKEDISTIEDPLGKVLNLRGVNFRWKDQDFPEGVQMGFIGQEAAQVIPEVINSQGEFLTMEYAPITALLVEAVKEQNKLIEEQRLKISDQETKISYLMDKILEIESTLSKGK